jgi:mannosyltransferase OCH1-like enzyme
MIPKIIHYCWFGRNEKSDFIKKCLCSWEIHLPDYEIVEWNEDNFDIDTNVFTKEAYSKKKWAFVSDYVRAYVLYNVGGIYLDTDVEIRSNLILFFIMELFQDLRDMVHHSQRYGVHEKGTNGQEKLLIIMIIYRSLIVQPIQKS